MSDAFDGMKLKMNDMHWPSGADKFKPNSGYEIRGHTTCASFQNNCMFFNLHILLPTIQLNAINYGMITFNSIQSITTKIPNSKNIRYGWMKKKNTWHTHTHQTMTHSFTFTHIDK